MNPDFLSFQETKGKPIISVLTDEELCQMSNMSTRLSTLAKVRHVRINHLNAEHGTSTKVNIHFKDCLFDQESPESKKTDINIASEDQCLLQQVDVLSFCNLP